MNRRGLLVRLIAVAVVSMFLLAPAATEVATAGAIDTFASGKSVETYDFSSSGMKDTVQLRVPVDGTVISGTLDVTGLAHANYQYPTAVRVFMGILNNEIYRYQGPGYGSMGFQYMFVDGTTSSTLVYEASGSDDTLVVRLPRGSTIQTAELRLTGELQDAGWAEPVRLSQQVGSNTVPISVGYRATPQLIDYDGDGDLDLMSGGYTTGPNQYLFFYENTGNSTHPTWSMDMTDFSSVSTAGWYYSVPRLVDLDQDKDFDLVFGQYYGTLLLYWNTGSASSPTWSSDGTGVDSVFYGIDEGYYATPDFADMDNDGDEDMAYGRYAYMGGESNVGVSSYRNDYNNNVYSWTTHNFFGGVTTDSYSAPYLVDFDGDGDYDLFVGYYNGTIGYYENTGSKAKPKWTQVPKVQGAIDVGSLATPSVGDLDGDGDLDMVIGSSDGYFYYYENLKSYPTNVSLDVGADGDTEKSLTGALSKATVVSGLENEFQSHIKASGRPSWRDEWGNQFDDVTIKLTSESPGRLVVDQLRIVYTYTMTSHDFGDALAGYIEANKGNADDEGYLKVPVIVMSATAGKVQLDNLKVVIDLAPKWSTIPSIFGIDEDTKDMALIDLRDYLVDDFDPLDKLKLEVVQVDQVGIVSVTLQGGRYVGVDAETGTANDNWNGKVTVYAVAWDTRNQQATSNKFTIEVRPVNDPPTLTANLPGEILEDANFEGKLAFNDVDGDPLKLDVTGLPAGMKMTDDGLLSWTPTNDDVGTYTVTFTVTDPSGARAELTWSFRVVNVNDPPTITLPAEITVTEGKPYYLNVINGISDVDNDIGELKVVVDGASGWAQFDGTTGIATIQYPKESGITDDELYVRVLDPEGAVATAIVRIRVIRVEKLDLFGIPDQYGVENEKWTLDIKPYLYNVDDWNKLVITTSSPKYITVSGTKLILYYPQDSVTSDTVTVTAKQADESATDSFSVSIKKLGADLALGIIPDQDVLEEEEHRLDITPYILKAPDVEQVVVTVKASEYITVEGRTLVFKYPLYHPAETEEVTVTIGYREFGDSATFTVRILNSEDDFVLTPIPDVTVTETVPETFNIKQYIKNAYDINYISASTDSEYADVNRFDIQLTYPAGYTMGEKQRDDVVRITISDGLRHFSRDVTVHVMRLGKTLQMSGIGDRTVYEDTDLVIDLENYLYNVDDMDEVAVSASPSMYAQKAGLVFTLRFPSGEGLTSVAVTFTATEGEDVAEETIMVYVEKVPLVFAFGPIGSITVREDTPYTLDVEPYLKNMAPGVTYKLGVLSEHATVGGLTITFLYEVEKAMDEIVRVNVTGGNGDFAEQDVYVHVKTVNDPPRLVEPLARDWSVVEGEPALVVDLTAHFADVDTERLEFTCDNELVRIDNENGTASVVFPMNSAKPLDAKDLVIYAYDPDEPSSMVESNRFNLTFYLAGEEPGPGPGPDTPGVQGPSGGSAWIVIALVAIAAVAGGGWMYYRRRKPPIAQ